MEEDRHHESGRSLRDVAAWLTTPAACGVFLSTFDLVRIAHSIGTSVTPLNRRFAVEQLFRSAAIADAPDPLFAALVADTELDGALDTGNMPVGAEPAEVTDALRRIASHRNA